MTISKGWEGCVRLSDTEVNLSGATDIKVQTAPITQATSLDTKYVIGQRAPYDIIEGPTEITGSLEKPFENLNFASNCGIQALDGALVSTPAEQVLGIFPQGYASGNDAIIVTGVKFGSWSVSLAPDDIIEETVDWSGESIEWKFVEDIGQTQI